MQTQTEEVERIVAERLAEAVEPLQKEIDRLGRELASLKWSVGGPDRTGTTIIDR